MAWSNSVAYGKTATGPIVRMNDANARDVTISTDRGTVTAAVVDDPAVRAGVVSMTHGHTEANPGVLTSGTTAIDPLTAMPHVAGLAVDVAWQDANDPEDRGPTG